MIIIKHSKRIKWLDFAKGFTIFFVVFYHVLAYSHFNYFYIKVLKYIIGIFIMPVFFAISGYLYNHIKTLNNFKTLLYKKTTSFLIPYIIFSLIIIYIQHMENVLNYINIIFHYFIDIVIIPSGYLWFLYILFIIFLIVGIMDLLHINILIQFIIGLIAILFQNVFSSQIFPLKNILDPVVGLFNPLNSFCGFFICFLMGRLIFYYRYTKILHSLVAVILTFMIWTLLILLQYLLYNTKFFNYINIINKLICIPLFFSIFIHMSHNKIFNYFDNYGKYTLVIYLVHLPIILLIFHILRVLNIYSFYIDDIPLLSIGILLIITILLSNFICYLSKKYCIVNFVFYPRKYFNKLIKWCK